MFQEVGAADNRTEIISPTNKQYKGRGAAVPKALRAFQVDPRLCSNSPAGGPEAERIRTEII